MYVLRPLMVLVWKDILLEVRSRELVVSVLVFGLLVAVVFNFALDVTPQRVAALAPGILWVAFAFAATMAMSRAFVREREQGGLEGLLLSPVSRDAIFLGKASANFLFMLLVELVLLPVFAVLFGFSALQPISGVIAPAIRSPVSAATGRSRGSGRRCLGCEGRTSRSRE